MLFTWSSYFVRKISPYAAVLASATTCSTKILNEADEVAGMVVCLANPESVFVTGADLLIGGGFAA
jgi:hypothetical protein